MQFTIIIILGIFITTYQQAEGLKDALNCLNTYIDTFRPRMDPKLFDMFKASYPNTLSTTVQHFDLTPQNQSTYIITGDIEAMWLRDSTNQFLPYMKITQNCPQIKQLALGLLNTQAELIMTDAYTNAFKKFENPSAQRHSYLNDKTQTLFFGVPVDLSRHKQFATKAIWERKFQLDSLASFLRLAYEYHRRYDTLDLVGIRFFKALKRIMTTVEQQTKDSAYEKRRKSLFYTFYRTPTELRDGTIRPAFGTGMVKTGFRPSDDPNDLAFNIPGNAMLCTYMDLVAKQILQKISKTSVFSEELSTLKQRMLKASQTIRRAIFQYGVVEANKMKVFAYEVNGLGQSRTFDDANLPSLLSLSYLQFVDQNDEIYKNTRNHILSQENPYFFMNGQIRGIGSSHTPSGNIWPLALITQILTTQNQEQIKNCLQSLKKHSADNLNHQSFSVRNPKSITRSWFAWANSLFGEMIITLSQKHPSTLQ